jgi:3-methyladenine DNA glycosylase AlkD
VRRLAGLARPAGAFDAERYFRGDHRLRFYNTGTASMRALARTVHASMRDRCSIDAAMALANRLVPDAYLETKSIGIELVARYKRDFSPKLLAQWKRWLASNQSANWATTDAICGRLVGPLLVRYPALADRMRAWARDRNLWVRRASIVSLIPLVRTGRGLGLAFAIARTLHRDEHDLIQKAVGWTLREAGKVDPGRLERYLRANGPTIPRTTVRYAVERFSPEKRRALLASTKATAHTR